MNELDVAVAPRLYHPNGGADLGLPQPYPNKHYLLIR